MHALAAKSGRTTLAAVTEQPQCDRPTAWALEGAPGPHCTLNVQSVEYPLCVHRTQIRALGATIALRIAVTNQKGGSGKTTTAINLAAALGELGHRVLIVDLDPQASASGWCGVRDGGAGLFELFANYDHFAATSGIESLIRPTPMPAVDLIPSGPSLSRAEKALASEPGAADIFADALQDLPERWDYVLFDCPPSLGLLTISALNAADKALVAAAAHPLTLDGLASLMQTITRIQERMNSKLQLLGVVVCRLKRTNLSRDVVAHLQERFGDAVLNAMVRENERVAEAPSHALPVTMYDSHSAGAEDYRAVAREILARMPLEAVA
jgi:chromosome partitioning protein